MRGGDFERDRHALDGDAHRAPLIPLDEGDDLRQRLEPPDRLGGILRRSHDREPLAAVAEAARVTGGLGAEALRDLARQRQRPVQQQRVRRRPGKFLRERRPELLLGLRPDPRHLPQPPLQSRLA